MDDRPDLDAMSRAGRQQRQADDKLQAEANSRAQHEKLSEGDRKQSRREEAELWRFAQRASLTFDRMVDAQIGSMFLFMSVLAWSFVGITEDRHALIRLGIVTIHSGEMPTKQLVQWCRDVVGRILPKMGTYGIASVSMECEGGGFVTVSD